MGRAELLATLLETEAISALDMFDYVGRTPLMWAVERGHVQCARLLIEAGADVNAVGGDDHPTCYTPLQRAVDERQVEAVKLLMRHGANPRLAACGMVASPIEMAKGDAEMTALLGPAGRTRRKR